MHDAEVMARVSGLTEHIDELLDMMTDESVYAIANSLLDVLETLGDAEVRTAVMHTIVARCRQLNGASSIIKQS